MTKIISILLSIAFEQSLRSHWKQVAIFFKLQSFSQGISELTPKQLEMHACLFSNVATDAMVLKHQAIRTHSADKISIVLDKFHTEILHL